MDETHVKEICKFGQGSVVCGFLAVGGNGFECLKGTDAEDLIRSRQSRGEMNAKGDNCSGPPYFQNSKGN